RKTTTAVAYFVEDDRRPPAHPATPPATTRAARPSTATTSPATSPRPRRASTSPLTVTRPAATASLASAPESDKEASLRNCPRVSLAPRSHSTSSTGGPAGALPVRPRPAMWRLKIGRAHV